MSANAALIDVLIPWTLPLSLVAIHFVADFILQSDWMALNKSRWTESTEGRLALTSHCLVYSACFLPFGVAFAAITFISHVLTDAVTSKITSKLWFVRPALNENNKPNGLFTYAESWKRHWFFVVIGADQLIHYFTLAGTYQWLF